MNKLLKKIYSFKAFFSRFFEFKFVVAFLQKLSAVVKKIFKKRVRNKVKFTTLLSIFLFTLRTSDSAFYIKHYWKEKKRYVKLLYEY